MPKTPLSDAVADATVGQDVGQRVCHHLEGELFIRVRCTSKGEEMKLRDRRWALSLTVAVALVVASCGGDDSNETAETATADTAATVDETVAATPASETTGAAESPDSAVSTAVGSTDGSDGETTTLRFTLDELVAGTEGAPPSDGPVAQTDKSVWVISCGEAVPSCVGPTAGAMEAGDAIGWDMTLFDGQLDPTRYGEGIRQAIAAGADGVIIAAIDCRVAEAPLREANAAGITVVAFYSIDCPDPTFDAEVQFNGYDGLDTSYATVVADWGASKARYLIDALDGDVKVISFREDDLQAVTSIYEGFERELATCATCEIVETIEFTFPDLLSPTGLRDQTTAALQAHPEANAVHSLYDGMSLLGLSQAVLESGRNDEVLMIGGEGFAPNLDLIRGNLGQDAAMAFPANWTGWDSVDTMNRLFAGEPNANSGNGWRIIDADLNMPAEGGYEPDVDYRSAYTAIWAG
jgi:ribose transport system substrate-binding protein